MDALPNYINFVECETSWMELPFLSSVVLEVYVFLSNMLYIFTCQFSSFVSLDQMQTRGVRFFRQESTCREHDWKDEGNQCPRDDVLSWSEGCLRGLHPSMGCTRSLQSTRGVAEYRFWSKVSLSFCCPWSEQLCKTISLCRVKLHYICSFAIFEGWLNISSAKSLPSTYFSVWVLTLSKLGVLSSSFNTGPLSEVLNVAQKTPQSAAGICLTEIEREPKSRSGNAILIKDITAEIQQCKQKMVKQLKFAEGFYELSVKDSR